jgi:hypothetical protein
MHDHDTGFSLGSFHIHHPHRLLRQGRPYAVFGDVSQVLEPAHSAAQSVMMHTSGRDVHVDMRVRGAVCAAYRVVCIGMQGEQPPPAHHHVDEQQHRGLSFARRMCLRGGYATFKGKTRLGVDGSGGCLSARNTPESVDGLARTCQETDKDGQTDETTAGTRAEKGVVAEGDSADNPESSKHRNAENAGNQDEDGLDEPANRALYTTSAQRFHTRIRARRKDVARSRTDSDMRGDVRDDGGEASMAEMDDADTSAYDLELMSLLRSYVDASMPCISWYAIEGAQPAGLAAPGLALIYANANLVLDVLRYRSIMERRNGRPHTRVLPWYVMQLGSVKHALNILRMDDVHMDALVRVLHDGFASSSGFWEELLNGQSLCEKPSQDAGAAVTGTSGPDASGTQPRSQNHGPDKDGNKVQSSDAAHDRDARAQDQAGQQRSDGHHTDRKSSENKGAKPQKPEKHNSPGATEAAVITGSESIYIDIRALLAMAQGTSQVSFNSDSESQLHASVSSPATISFRGEESICNLVGTDARAKYALWQAATHLLRALVKETMPAMLDVIEIFSRFAQSGVVDFEQFRQLVTHVTSSPSVQLEKEILYSLYRNIAGNERRGMTLRDFLTFFSVELRLDEKRLRQRDGELRPDGHPSRQRDGTGTHNAGAPNVQGSVHILPEDAASIGRASMGKSTSNSEQDDPGTAPVQHAAEHGSDLQASTGSTRPQSDGRDKSPALNNTDASKPLAHAQNASIQGGSHGKHTSLDQAAKPRSDHDTHAHEACVQGDQVARSHANKSQDQASKQSHARGSQTVATENRIREVVSNAMRATKSFTELTAPWKRAKGTNKHAHSGSDTNATRLSVVDSTVGANCDSAKENKTDQIGHTHDDGDKSSVNVSGDREGRPDEPSSSPAHGLNTTSHTRPVAEEIRDKTVQGLRSGQATKDVSDDEIHAGTLRLVAVEIRGTYSVAELGLSDGALLSLVEGIAQDLRTEMARKMRRAQNIAAKLGKTTDGEPTCMLIWHVCDHVARMRSCCAHL